MEQCVESKQKLEEIFLQAMERLSDDVKAMIGEPKKSDGGYHIPVIREERQLPMRVMLFSSLAEACCGDHDISAIQEDQRGLPTISVQVLGYGDLSSYRLSDVEAFVNELKRDLERQALYAYGLIA